MERCDRDILANSSLQDRLERRVKSRQQRRPQQPSATDSPRPNYQRGDEPSGSTPSAQSWRRSDTSDTSTHVEDCNHVVDCNDATPEYIPEENLNMPWSMRYGRDILIVSDGRRSGGAKRRLWDVKVEGIFKKVDGVKYVNVAYERRGKRWTGWVPASDIYNRSSIEWGEYLSFESRDRGSGRYREWKGCSLGLERVGCDGRTELAVLVKGRRKWIQTRAVDYLDACVFVEHADGVTYAIPYSPLMTVKEVLNQLAEKSGLLIDERTHYLSVRGHKALYGKGRSLAQYGIQANDTLAIQVRGFGGSVSDECDPTVGVAIPDGANPSRELNSSGESGPDVQMEEDGPAGTSAGSTQPPSQLASDYEESLPRTATCDRQQNHGINPPAASSFQRPRYLQHPPPHQHTHDWTSSQYSHLQAPDQYMHLEGDERDFCSGGMSGPAAMKVDEPVEMSAESAFPRSWNVHPAQPAADCGQSHPQPPRQRQAFPTHPPPSYSYGRTPHPHPPHSQVPVTSHHHRPSDYPPTDVHCHPHQYMHYDPAASGYYPSHGGFRGTGDHAMRHLQLGQTPVPQQASYEPVTCDGLGAEKSARLDRLAESDSNYVHSNFSKLKGQYRSSNCDVNTSKQCAEKDGWNYLMKGDIWRCKSCSTELKNFNRHNAALQEMDSSKARQQSAEILPSSKEILQNVEQYFRSLQINTSGGFDEGMKPILEGFCRDQRIKEGLVAVRGRGDSTKIISSHPCTGRIQYRISLCEGNRCEQVLAKINRSNTDGFCNKCRKDSFNRKASDETREKNYDQQCAVNSKTNERYLNDEQRKQKSKHQRYKIKNQNRKIKSLQDAIDKLKERIENDSVCLDGSEGTGFLDGSDTPRRAACENYDGDEDDASPHKAFLDDMQTICTEVLNDGSSKETMKKILVAVLKDTVESEAKTSEDLANFNESDKRVLDLVDTITEQISNISKDITNKKKQCRYGPVTMQLAYAIWSRSPASYREMRAIVPHMTPCPRQLAKMKKANKVEDGCSNIGVYILRLSVLNGKPEYGYLMCDEMKLKHGVIWNAQTGEATGLADDMLDLKATLARLLSDEGDEVKPAVYVNQWRFIGFSTDKVKGWNCGFFFNDGSLTSETLMNQFQHVTLCCEAIGSKVYGLVMDAGGNNAKFASRLRDEKRFDDTTTWIDEDLCYVKNFDDPSRRIYVWFCMTHLFKAMRNQLLASYPGRSKMFVDEFGTNFGWAIIDTLNWEIEKANRDSTSRCKVDCRVNDSVANPTNYRKMDVTIAKITSENKTLQYGINMLCEKLDLKPENVFEEVNKRLTQKENPFLQLGKSSGTHRERRHGFFFEAAMYLYEYIRDQETAYEGEDLNRPKQVYVASTLAEENGFDEDDDDDEELREHIALLESGKITLEGAKPPPKPKTPSYRLHGEKLHCEASSLVYLGALNGIFNTLLLNKEEQFNVESYAQYKRFLEDVLSYFGRMKAAQLARRHYGAKDWEKQFLDRITWRNLRGGICPFVYFAKYVLDEIAAHQLIPGFKHVPVLAANQSSLERQFSGARGGGYDTAPRYGSGITNQSINAATAAQNASRSYDAGDCADTEEGTNSVTGTAKFTQRTKHVKCELERWREGFSKEDKDPKPSDEFLDRAFLESAQLQNLAGKLNLHCPNSGFLARFIDDMYLHQWFQLSVHNNDRKQWFCDLVKTPGEEIDRVCRKILKSIFGMVEKVLTSKRDLCYEKLFLDYISDSDEFKFILTTELPQNLRGQRQCVVYLADVLKKIMDKAIYLSVKEMVTAARPGADDPEIDVDDELFVTTMQKMVGGGIRKAKNQFCPKKERGECTEAEGKQHDLFEKLFFRHDTKESPGANYKAYYPNMLHHSDMSDEKGGLHLIKLKFIPWARELLKHVCELYSTDNLFVHRVEYIAANMKKLKEDGSHFATFKAAVGQDGPDESYLAKVHLRIVLYVFRAFTKRVNNDRFNRCKTISGDISNLTHRQRVQTGVSDVKMDDNSPPGAVEEDRKKMNEVRKDLGLAAKRKAKRTQDEIKKGQKEDYRNAFDKMCGYEHGIAAGMELEFGKIKMTNPEKMALLTHGFNDYTTTGRKAELEKKVQDHVNKHGDEDPPKMPFFQEYLGQRTNKRPSHGTTGLTPPPKKSANPTKKK